MSIYSAVKELAQHKKISIYKMEHDLGFPNGIISKWDHSMPGADKLQLVADYLGVTTAFVLNKSKEN